MARRAKARGRVKARVSKAKARKILKDGKIRGKKLTRRQQKLFGYLAH